MIRRGQIRWERPVEFYNSHQEPNEVGIKGHDSSSFIEWVDRQLENVNDSERKIILSRLGRLLILTDHPVYNDPNYPEDEFIGCLQGETEERLRTKLAARGIDWQPALIWTREGFRAWPSMEPIP